MTSISQSDIPSAPKKGFFHLLRMRQIVYLFQFQSSLSYRLLFAYGQIVKGIRVLLGLSYRPSHFPIRGEYTITNELGTFHISEPSDMHPLLTPGSEDELRSYFNVDSGIFLDIGANIGKYSVYVARRGVQTYAFEPNPTLAKNYLRENIRLNHLEEKINIVEYALSDTSGTATLNVPTVCFGGASIVDVANNTEHTTVNVPLKRLDDWVHETNLNLENVRLIKIDVEGYEESVIR